MIGKLVTIFAGTQIFPSAENLLRFAARSRRQNNYGEPCPLASKRSCSNRYKLFSLSVSLLFVLVATFTTYCQAQEAKERIVSLTPATTEILYALDLEDQIVGVSTFCNYPEQARQKEKVGSFSNPNIEKIILLDPDLVFVTGLEQEHFKGVLSRFGIDFLTVDPKNIDELLISIKEIGEVTKKQKKAAALARDTRAIIDNISKRLDDLPAKERPRVYMEIWHDPIMSPGGDSFVNDMIEKAGGISVTSSLRRGYSKVVPEKILYSNPNIIVLVYMKTREWIKKNFSRRIGWAGIDAVRNDRIYSDINADLILRPGPRVKEGLMELYNRFYEN